MDGCSSNDMTCGYPNVRPALAPLLVDLPGIEPDCLPGNMPSELRLVPARSGSFPLVTCGFVLESRRRKWSYRVRNGDNRVADLYAECGVAQIAGHPKPEMQEIFQVDNPFIAIVDVPTNYGNQNAVDVFEICDEGIRRLVIFPRAQ
jgi:hypothetical protein